MLLLWRLCIIACMFPVGATVADHRVADILFEPAWLTDYMPLCRAAARGVVSCRLPRLLRQLLSP